MQRHKDTGLSNWREPPHSQWSFQHVRELIPTAQIGCGNTEPVHSMKNIECSPELNSFLVDTHTDAFLVYRGGKEAEQWTAPHYDQANPHIIFSISKSVTAMLTGILVDKGVLETEQLVSHYLPQTENSAYGTCTVQHVLDMTVALDFTEDYLNPDGDYFNYRNATGWNPVDQTVDSPSLETLLYGIKKAPFQHGVRFNYKSPNTDLMGLLLERISGVPFAQLLSNLIWQPMGATSDAYVTVDKAMLARAAGGMCVTPQDLARFGQLVLGISQQSDRTTTKPVIPKQWITDTLNGGDRNAWLQGDMKSLLPNGRYRNYWYQTGNDDQCFCAIGIHGQWLYINPRTNCVIVKLSSQPLPLDEKMDTRCLEAFEKISTHQQ